MIYINARCKKILSMLLAGSAYISLRQIATEMGLSKRSIYYDLCKINEWLEYYGVPELEVVRGKGILIPEEDKRKIETISEKENKEESYIFSPTERVKIIYCYILICHLNGPIYIDQLAEYCQVSRNTIFNDLRVMVNQLQEYKLVLNYGSKRGYRIGGDVINIRALFFLYFNTLIPLFGSGVLDFVNQEAIKDDLDKLKQIEKELNTEYVNGVLMAIAALMPVMYRAARRPYFPSLKMERIEKTEEYRLACTFFPDLDPKEQIYLCLHLLGSRVTMKTVDVFDNQADQSVYEIAKALTDEFEKTACVSFDDREELERALFVHINTSLYRYQYGIQVGNPIEGDIMREYPDLFDITKRVSKYLEQLMGLPIPDSEVAYLALHFGAHLKRNEPEENELRILIVCASGISTGNMLKREVEKLLPHAKIIDVVAEAHALKVAECDLIISTVKVKSVVPAIIVHPILTDYDRKAIRNHQLVARTIKADEADAVFQIVKKYVPESACESLKEDLQDYYRTIQTTEETMLTGVNPGFLEALGGEQIEVVKESCSWQDAIRRAGTQLLHKGTIEPGYLDCIISQIERYGSYMAIAPGLLLAHAAPGDGVKRLDVSMTVFGEPVLFPDEREIRVIITLAAEDQEKHLKILRDIMNIFSEEKHVEKAAGLRKKEEILEYLAGILENK